MPVYDFSCTNADCGNVFEESVPLTEFDTRIVVCPKCEGKCNDCEGTGETWLGTEYSGHKDCVGCGGNGQRVAKRQLVALKGAHTTWKNWRT